jgi:hypothetical protein
MLISDILALLSIISLTNYFFIKYALFAHFEMGIYLRGNPLMKKRWDQ